MSDYWKDNNIDKPQQVIVCSALFYKKEVRCNNKSVNGIVITGARHFDSTMIVQIQLLGLKGNGIPIQGFIDQFGIFHDREEAMKIVLESGQRFNVERNGTPSKELFSEGLY